MSKLTLDEAIKRCEEVAENEEKLSIEGKWFEGEDWNVKARAQCAECASDHRQLAAWLRELKELRETVKGMYHFLGEYFEYPCSDEKVAAMMKEKSTCFDCDGKVTNEECWRRFFTVMIGGDSNDD